MYLPSTPTCTSQPPSMTFLCVHHYFIPFISNPFLNPPLTPTSSPYSPPSIPSFALPTLSNSSLSSQISSSYEEVDPPLVESLRFLTVLPPQIRLPIRHPHPPLRELPHGQAPPSPQRRWSPPRPPPGLRRRGDGAVHRERRVS